MFSCAPKRAGRNSDAPPHPEAHAPILKLRERNKFPYMVPPESFELVTGRDVKHSIRSLFAGSPAFGALFPMGEPSRLNDHAALSVGLGRTRPKLGFR